MRKLFKKLLIGLALVALPIMGYSQHIIDNRDVPKSKSSVGSYNFKHLRTGVRESMDSIHVSSAEILAGDSILMLKGSKEAALTWVAVDYTAVSTPYTTTGSTDTTFVYVKTDLGNKKVCGLNDNVFDETLSANPTSSHVETPGGMVDSCLYWLSIPTSKYSLGNGHFVLYYKYIIIE